MKRIFAILVALAVSAGVTACGDKSSGGGAAGGGSGIVGTWTLDMEKFMDMAMAEGKKALAGMPEDQRKLAEEMMGGKDARAMMEKKFAGMRLEFNVAADKTFTGTTQENATAKAENVTGTWEETGGRYVFTTKTKDGQPATAADAKPVEGKLVGGNLAMTMPGGGPEMVFKRK